MTSGQIPNLDAASVEIGWSRLISAVDEAAATLVRTSFSTVVRESYDFSCVLTDVKGRSIAQATESIPSFISTLPRTVRVFLDRFGAAAMQEGDAFITNDPWLGTGHLSDVTVVRPIFYHGRLIGFAASVAHAPDMGGRTGSLDLKDVFEEGFQIPPMQLARVGTIDATFLQLLRANVRVPDEVEGDLMAQLSALSLMGERVGDLLDDAQLKDLEVLSHSIRSRSEEAFLAALRNCPHGTWKYTLQTDGLGSLLEIKLAVTISADGVEVDYEGTSPQVAGAINVALCYTYAYTAYALKCLFAPEIPNNDGAFVRVAVKAPEGSLLNHRYPASGGSRSLVGHFLPGAVLAALSPALPAKVIAGSGSLWSMQALVTDASGRQKVGKFFFNGGTGAAFDRKGHAALSWPSNISATPVELIERTLPVRVLHRRLWAGSGGDGSHRGGEGQEFAMELIGDVVMSVSFNADRTKVGAPGLFGGSAGRVGEIRINGKLMDPRARHSLARGDRLELRVPGGGGFGKAGSSHAPVQGASNADASDSVTSGQ